MNAYKINFIVFLAFVCFKNGLSIDSEDDEITGDLRFLPISSANEENLSEGDKLLFLMPIELEQQTIRGSQKTKRCKKPPSFLKLKLSVPTRRNTTKSLSKIPSAEAAVATRSQGSSKEPPANDSKPYVRLFSLKRPKTPLRSSKSFESNDDTTNRDGNVALLRETLGKQLVPKSRENVDVVDGKTQEKPKSPGSPCDRRNYVCYCRQENSRNRNVNDNPRNDRLQRKKGSPKRNEKKSRKPAAENPEISDQRRQQQTVPEIYPHFQYSPVSDPQIEYPNNLPFLPILYQVPSDFQLLSDLDQPIALELPDERASFIDTHVSGEYQREPDHDQGIKQAIHGSSRWESTSESSATENQVGSKWNEGKEEESTKGVSSEASTGDSLGGKFRNAEECMTLYGRDICVIKGTTERKENSDDNDDLPAKHNENIIKINEHFTEIPEVENVDKNDCKERDDYSESKYVELANPVEFTSDHSRNLNDNDYFYDGFPGEVPSETTIYLPTTDYSTVIKTEMPETTAWHRGEIQNKGSVIYNSKVQPVDYTTFHPANDPHYDIHSHRPEHEIKVVTPMESELNVTPHLAEYDPIDNQQEKAQVFENTGELTENGNIGYFESTEDTSEVTTDKNHQNINDVAKHLQDTTEKHDKNLVAMRNEDKNKYPDSYDTDDLVVKSKGDSGVFSTEFREDCRDGIDENTQSSIAPMESERSGALVGGIFHGASETATEGTLDYSEIKEVTRAYFTSKAYDNETAGNLGYTGSSGYEDFYITSSGPTNPNFSSVPDSEAFYHGKDILKTENTGPTNLNFSSVPDSEAFYHGKDILKAEDSDPTNLNFSSVPDSEALYRGKDILKTEDEIKKTQKGGVESSTAYGSARNRILEKSKSHGNEKEFLDGDGEKEAGAGKGGDGTESKVASLLREEITSPCLTEDGLLGQSENLQGSERFKGENVNRDGDSATESDDSLGKEQSEREPAESTDVEIVDEISTVLYDVTSAVKSTKYTEQSSKNVDDRESYRAESFPEERGNFVYATPKMENYEEYDEKEEGEEEGDIENTTEYTIADVDNEINTTEFLNDETTEFSNTYDMDIENDEEVEPSTPVISSTVVTTTVNSIEENQEINNKEESTGTETMKSIPLTSVYTTPKMKNYAKHAEEEEKVDDGDERDLKDIAEDIQVNVNFKTYSTEFSNEKTTEFPNEHDTNIENEGEIRSNGDDDAEKEEDTENITDDKTTESQNEHDTNIENEERRQSEIRESTAPLISLSIVTTTANPIEENQETIKQVKSEGTENPSLIPVASESPKNSLPFRDNALLQNSIKRVINNFALNNHPETAYDGSNLETKELEEERFSPEILGLPNFKDIFSLPEVEDTVVENVKKFLSEFTKQPKEDFTGDSLREMIKNTLKNMMEAMPSSRTKLPPMTVVEHQYKDGEWTENLVTLVPKLLHSKENKNDDDGDNDAEFIEQLRETVRNFVHHPVIGVQNAREPIVQSIITAAVKNSLKSKDAERMDLMDCDSMIRGALENLILPTQASNQSEANDADSSTNIPVVYVGTSKGLADVKNETDETILSTPKLHAKEKEFNTTEDLKRFQESTTTDGENLLVSTESNNNERNPEDKPSYDMKIHNLETDKDAGVQQVETAITYQRASEGLLSTEKHFEDVNPTTDILAVELNSGDCEENSFMNSLGAGNNETEFTTPKFLATLFENVELVTPADIKADDFEETTLNQGTLTTVTTEENELKLSMDLEEPTTNEVNDKLVDTEIHSPVESSKIDALKLPSNTLEESANNIKTVEESSVEVTSKVYFKSSTTIDLKEEPDEISTLEETTPTETSRQSGSSENPMEQGNPDTVSKSDFTSSSDIMSSTDLNSEYLLGSQRAESIGYPSNARLKEPENFTSAKTIKYYSPNDRVLEYIKNHGQNVEDCDNVETITKTTEGNETGLDLNVPNEERISEADKVTIITESDNGQSNLYENYENHDVSPTSRATEPTKIPSSEPQSTTEDYKFKFTTPDVKEFFKAAQTPYISKSVELTESQRPQITTVSQETQETFKAKEKSAESTDQNFARGKLYEKEKKIQKGVAATTEYREMSENDAFERDPVNDERKLTGNHKRIKDEDRRHGILQASLNSPISAPEDLTYLGRITLQNKESSDVSDLQKSDLYYIGDGVKLPLEIRKLKDGSYALSISKKVCEHILNKECPCCVPLKGNVVLSSKKNSNIDEITENPEENEKILKRRLQRSINNNLETLSMPVVSFAKKYNLKLDLNNQKTSRSLNKQVSKSFEESPESSSGMIVQNDSRSSEKGDLKIQQRRNNEDLIKRLLAVDKVPKDKRTDVLIETLKDLIENRPVDIGAEVNGQEVKIEDLELLMEKDNAKDSLYSGLDEEMMKYGYQVNNPILERIKFVKKMQEQPGQYRYQRNINEILGRKTEVMKIVLDWLKGLFLRTH